MRAIQWIADRAITLISRADLRLRLRCAGLFSPDGAKTDRAAAAGMDRLYTDVETHTAEEARRFGLVEEHWDVVVVG